MAAERTPGGFGSKLREARERRGVTLRQIADATKISAGQLEALERNDISRLPGGIFSRAFVRSYAIEVGLDPEEMIQEFIAQFPNDSVTAGHPTSQHVDDPESLESDRRMASVFLRLIALSIPVAGIVLYFGLSGRRAAGPPAPKAASVERPSPVVAPASAATDPSGGSPSSDVASDRLTVGILATSPCWVSATVDGRRAFERQFQTGERQQVEARHELVLTVADGSALTLTLNGAQTKPLGKAGEMVTWRLNPTNIKDFLAAR
jgi:cytoskeletal protein RodZ